MTFASLKSKILPDESLSLENSNPTVNDSPPSTSVSVFILFNSNTLL